MTTIEMLRFPPPRSPLVTEMEQAGRLALLQHDPMHRAYLTGLYLGYGVAFGLVPRNVLDDARRQPDSFPVAWDEWRPRWDAIEDTARAIGVRRGYWLGTTELPGVDECGLCGDRLCDDFDWSQRCQHGTYCGEGCFDEWHSEPSVRTCVDDGWDVA